MINKQKFKIILLIAGFIIFCALIYRVGPTKLYHHLYILKWKLFLLLLPYILVYILDTLGWKYAFKENSTNFKNLFMVRLAGESLNMIIPSAYFAGEPVKAYFLKRYNIPMVDGIASIVISKAIMIITQILFVMFGVVFLLFKSNISGFNLISSIAITLLGVPLIMFIIFIQKRGIFSFLLKILRMLRIRIRYIEERANRLRELDERIFQFYSYNKKRFFISFAFFFLGWIAGMIEVFLILYLLGVPIDYLSIYIIESLSTAAKGITSFIPGSVGGQEGGIIMIFITLKLSVGIALTFAILRRLRELIWIAAGLFILSRLEWMIAESPIKE
ncbi:MAG: flippase-like domain-containing protein [Candidatus Scalinduaceae bacterium]